MDIASAPNSFSPKSTCGWKKSELNNPGFEILNTKIPKQNLQSTKHSLRHFHIPFPLEKRIFSRNKGM